MRTVDGEHDNPIGPRCFRATVDGVPGDWWFRVPPRRISAPLVQAIADAYGAKDLDAVEACRGALIAACWASPSVALESTTGAEVHDELWDAGWPLESIAATAAGLTDQIHRLFTASVEARVDFFSSTREGEPATWNYTLGRPTSETPTPSTP